MNREQKIKAIEEIIHRQGLGLYQTTNNQLAIVIVDSMEIDKNKIRKIIFGNTYVDKGGFSGQPEVSGISKTVKAITSDIIKIKE